MRALLDDVDDGVMVDPAKMTVGDYLTNRWLPALEGRGLSVKASGYRHTVRVHIVPHLGAIRLQMLDTPAIELMLSKMARAKKSPKTRRNVAGVLSKALTDARRWNLVGRNAASGVELPKLSKRPPRGMEPEQLATFLDAVDHDRLAPLWRFFVISGARRGEVAGLRWRDVDLDEAVAVITNNRVVIEGGVDEKDVRAAPGTARWRSTRDGRRHAPVADCAARRASSTRNPARAWLRLHRHRRAAAVAAQDHRAVLEGLGRSRLAVNRWAARVAALGGDVPRCPGGRRRKSRGGSAMTSWC